MGLMNIFQPVESLADGAWDDEVLVESTGREEYWPTGRDQTLRVPARTPKRQSVKQGLNWTVLAGGAFATAVSVAFCRKRQRSSPASTDTQPTKSVRAMAIPGTEGKKHDTLSVGHTAWQRQLPRTSPSASDTRRPVFGMITSYEYNTEAGKDAYGPAYPPTPQVNEHIRFKRTSVESEDTPTLATPPYQLQTVASSFATPTTPQDWEKQDFNISSRANRSAKQNMLQRLRQQVKSRDEMILEIHAQVRDQERTIRLQEAQRRELEGRVQTVNRSLHEAEVEIRRLTNALSCRFPISDSAGQLCGFKSLKSESHENALRECVCSSHPLQQACQQRLHQQQQELQRLSSEVQRMASQLKDVEQDRKEREMSAALKQRENEFLVNRLKQIEAELEGAKNSNLEKDHLVQQYQAELINITEAKSKKVYVPLAEAGRKEQLTETVSMSLHSQVDSKDNLNLKSATGEVASTPVAESFTHNSVVRSYNLLFATTPQPSSGGDSPSRMCLAENDVELEADGEVIETLLVALQEEVDQLSTALEKTSKVVLDKQSQASQLLDNLEGEEYLLNHSQFQRTLEELGPSALQDEQDWEELSHVLSLSKGITSAAQVQELSYKLEQVARQQKVEEEILQLGKHQNRITELKQRIERVSLRVSCSQDEDGDGRETTEKRATRLASLTGELAKKLNLQEQQAQMTCSEAQGLSTTAHHLLSSPYVPTSKKVEMRRILNNSHLESELRFSERWHGRTSTSVEYGTRVRYPTESEEATQFSRKGVFDNTTPSAELSPFQSPSSDRKFSSFLNIEDSPAVRIGSPTIAGDAQSPLTSEMNEGIRDTSRFYGSKAVKVETDGPIHLSARLSSTVPSTSMSPFSKMMARLDLNQAVKASNSSPRDLEDYCRHILESYGPSQDKVLAEASMPAKLQRRTPSASCTGSLDSSLDEMLDNTLEDLVRVCSEASTPVTSPGTSVVSSDYDNQRSSRKQHGEPSEQRRL